MARCFLLSEICELFSALQSKVFDPWRSRAVLYPEVESSSGKSWKKSGNTQKCELMIIDEETSVEKT